ncbi:MAG: terpene cyclase/mutase family protein [Gemmataceae bacterium]|nr:terpene cyclase/mutase family protein [Gemmataceae bacterium]
MHQTIPRRDEHLLRILTFFVLWIAAAFFAATSLHAQPPAKDRLEESVDKALVFLANMQEKDGAWGAFSEKNIAITGLAVMAFLSAGHVPGEGPHGDAVEKGIRWILSRQQPNGMLAMEGSGGISMYHHGICTMVLAESVGMCDAKLSKEIRPKLVKAAEVILKAQRTQPGIYQGGWRYQPEQQDADLSVTGWQMLALRAAKNVGCDVPVERMEMAVGFLKNCRDVQSGGFTYFPGGRITKACTGTAILGFELVGKKLHHAPESLQAGSYLLKHPLAWNDEHFFYSSYYVSQALFQLGNNYWTLHRGNMHKILFAHQQTNGSWLANEGYGPVYATSLAVLTLTVEYRYLPIYQRDEGPAPKK